MAGADQEAVVRPEMKVAEVLRRWPHLLPVLVEASPAFRKLENPLLRKTLKCCPKFGPPQERGQGV